MVCSNEANQRKLLPITAPPGLLLSVTDAAELDSLLRRLQHTDSQICAVARHASRESQPPHQPQREALQQEGGVHAVRGRQPATPEHRVTRGVPMRSPAMQMPCYSSCPTALDSPLSPDATSCRGYRTIALPPH